MSIEPKIEGSDLMLSHLGNKMKSGTELTNAEEIMSTVSAHKDRQDTYGPSPENFEVSSIPLAPDVVGQIINHTI